MEVVLDRCTVRTWQDGDAAALAHHANSRAVWRNLRDRFPHPYTLHDAELWVRFARDVAPQTHFAIVVDGVAAGGVGVEVKSDVSRRSAEIGFWLGEPFWGRGIATAATRALVDYTFATFNVCRIYADVFAWNVASMRVLEKAGFVREAVMRKAAVKDGQIIDVMLYALVRE